LIATFRSQRLFQSAQGPSVLRTLFRTFPQKSRKKILVFLRQEEVEPVVIAIIESLLQLSAQFAFADRATLEHSPREIAPFFKLSLPRNESSPRTPPSNPCLPPTPSPPPSFIDNGGAQGSLVIVLFSLGSLDARRRREPQNRKRQASKEET